MVLLERGQPPRYKTCGGGLVGRSLCELEGVAFEAERVCRRAIFGLADPRLEFVVEREEPLVCMVMRAEFDHGLVRAACAAGAEFQAGEAFEGLTVLADGVEVRTPHERLRAGLVVGADGSHSRVAAAAGWRRSPRVAAALEGELELAPERLAELGDLARFDFGDPTDGYAWVFPKREHVSVGVLATRDGSGLKGRLFDLLRRRGLEGGRLELHGFTIPLAPRPGGPARGRVLLAGDAAGLADPVTAEGISFALRSGRLVGEAYAAACGDPTRVGRCYAARLRRDLAPELASARLLARVLYDWPGLRGRLFRHHGAALCEAVAEVISGRSTYRSTLARPSHWLRLLRTGAGRRPRASG